MYRNEHLERSFCDKIHTAAIRCYGKPIPQAVRERISIEEQHIFAHGYATMFATIARLAEFSKLQGYPVSFRGNTGNLILAYLAGIVANDPMELGLLWESCLGPYGNRMPEITLNVADALRDSLLEHLKSLLPECDVVWDLPGMPSWKIIIIPKKSGPYDPSSEYFNFSLCPHELMSMVGQAMQHSHEMPKHSNILSGDFLSKVRHIDMAGIPVFSDLAGLMEFVRELEPRTFGDLVKIMGICLAPEIRFQVQKISGPNLFDKLIATREDVYDTCVQHGISDKDAFFIMQQTSKGDFDRLPTAYLDMLDAKKLPMSFIKATRATRYLYPRGQCAEYIYWALVLAWYRQNGVI